MIYLAQRSYFATTLAALFMTLIYSMEYAVPEQRGSHVIESCGSLATRPFSWTISGSSVDGSTASNRLFHLYRNEPDCRQARRLHLGSLGVTFGVVALSALARCLRRRTVRSGVGLLLLAAGAWSAGVAIWDGPIVAYLVLATAALIAAVPTMFPMRPTPPLWRDDPSAMMDR
ncbi:MAG: hypothetical protein QOH36_1033 [Actinomycetota bacterium]|nr:hypothetical protein [Actinomycetota bacterium]